MKPQFETYRYVGEICPIKSQSIVECRLPGSEIGSILAIHAQVVPGNAPVLTAKCSMEGNFFNPSYMKIWIRKFVAWSAERSFSIKRRTRR